MSISTIIMLAFYFIGLGGGSIALIIYSLKH